MNRRAYMSKGVSRTTHFHPPPPLQLLQPWLVWCDTREKLKKISLAGRQAKQKGVFPLTKKNQVSTKNTDSQQREEHVTSFWGGRGG